MRINYILSILTLSTLFISCDPNNRSQYEDSIYKERREKDKIFKFQKESPLSNQQKIDFTSLNYFPIDSAYKMEAKVEKITDPQIIQMKYSDGEIKDYKKYAWLTFNYKGENYKLLAYQSFDLLEDPSNANHLFVPFFDATTGDETYSGGRYLDLHVPAGNTIELDFNKAYNPYCVYNPGYSCPIPPGENRIPVPIKAGEKDF